MVTASSIVLTVMGAAPCLHESHGVHVCHKCGWPFPNPHPSAKHRRAHKKIGGTIEGYKLLVSESQTHSVSSDDEQLSDDDRNTKASGLLFTPDYYAMFHISSTKNENIFFSVYIDVQNALDAHNNEKDCVGTGENLNRSGDEVFLDAIANFSDGGLSPGNKESLRDSLDSATDMETVDRKYPDISGYSEDNDFNAGDVNQLIVKSRDDGKMQDPNILQSERGEDGKMLELKGQLLNSSVNPLSNSITDLRTKEFTVAHSDDCFGLSSDSVPSKAGAAPAGLLENKIFAGENMRDCSLTSVAKETDVKAKGEIKSDRDMAEIVVSSYMSETCEGVTELAVSNVVNSDCQVASGALI
ncbi:Zinc finger C2H2-type [Sesbania bispinosa]|nr:Zinc finger C2H2-type [Sesbania bispinosa]